MKKEEKPKFTCISKINKKEYIEAGKHITKFYWYYVLKMTYLNIFITLLISLFEKERIFAIIFFIIYELSIMIYYKLNLEKSLGQSYDELKGKNNIDNNRTIEFYDYHFIVKGENSTYKDYYLNYFNNIETDSHFYLINKKQNFIIYIQKSETNLELDNFIKEKFNPEYKKLKQKNKNKNFMKYLINTLFILTIIIPFVVANIYAKFPNFKHISWLVLPIPITSLILGIINNKNEKKSLNNIISSIIVIVFLIIVELFANIQNKETIFSKETYYKEEYINIINANLPNNGIIKTDKYYFEIDENKKDALKRTIYYGTEDTNNLNKSIENNTNWIIYESLPSKLSIFLPFIENIEKTNYISIYNKTTNEYNTLPKTNGDYEIYSIIYKQKEKQIKIYSFTYNYKDEE